jgi:hypothetical protein
MSERQTDTLAYLIDLSNTIANDDIIASKAARATRPAQLIVYMGQVKYAGAVFFLIQRTYLPRLREAMETVPADVAKDVKKMIRELGQDGVMGADDEEFRQRFDDPKNEIWETIIDEIDEWRTFLRDHDIDFDSESEEEEDKNKDDMNVEEYSD